VSRTSGWARDRSVEADGCSAGSQYRSSLCRWKCEEFGEPQIRIEEIIYPIQGLFYLLSRRKTN